MVLTEHAADRCSRRKIPRRKVLEAVHRVPAELCYTGARLYRWRGIEVVVDRQDNIVTVYRVRRERRRR
jgi:hypothetical protein